MIFITFCIGDGFRIFLIIYGDNFGCTQFFQNGNDSLGRAALAQNQCFFAGNINAVFLEQITETVKIRIIAAKPAVSIDNRIDCADFLRAAIYLIQIRDNRFLIGNGYALSPTARPPIA